MNSERQISKSINKHRQLARFVVLPALLLFVVGTFPTFGADVPTATLQPITISQLAGPWQIGIVGNTGCGFSSMLLTVSLSATGTGPATLTGHSGCGDTVGIQTFTINSLSANGSGTANLTCGPGCGWNFAIQVAPDKQVFNLVDVTDPLQYLAGTAVKQ
jgi:hypothetical protein